MGWTQTAASRVLPSPAAAAASQQTFQDCCSLPSTNHPSAPPCTRLPDPPPVAGSCVLDCETGEPVLLYTGVRLRSNAEAGPLPPPEHDLGMVGAGQGQWKDRVFAGGSWQ